ncbi:ChbG/HpnK family deacetylase [Melaminivora alkalimesophila]|uniref:Uncharacterized protein n=1 Tax=Melaminivora alkalimesophila TaxID=1165852 RepID=A0A317REK2_9BURK|nr:ChbG/HpnK family deacetylase [Melaminivora alkalimesophila]PWW45869.1 hypothetical protein DFR36_10571 [Melaminivora alkalimesophila]
MTAGDVADEGVRSIVLCADDYALHPAVDEAVCRLAAQGRLSATSCMATSPRWREAAAALQGLRPGLAAGLHLNLTEAHGGAVEARTLGQVLRQAYLRGLPRAQLQAALRAQLDAFEQALGTPPDFLDGHQHVHQLPGVRELVEAELQRRYALHERPWLRSTVPAGGLWRTPKAAALALLGGWSATRRWRAAGLQANRGFAGVYGFDAPDVAAYRAHMRRWLAHLAPGGVLMCHPAVALLSQDAIGHQRPVEFAYLASEAFAQDLEEAGRAIHRGPRLPVHPGRDGR